VLDEGGGSGISSCVQQRGSGVARELARRGGSCAGVLRSPPKLGCLLNAALLLILLLLLLLRSPSLAPASAPLSCRWWQACPPALPPGPGAPCCCSPLCKAVWGCGGGSWRDGRVCTPCTQVL